MTTITEGVPSNESKDKSPHIVLLAGPGDTTDIVANWLDENICRVMVVSETAQSRVQLTRRRIARLGLLRVVGQVLFVSIAMPVLRIQARSRRHQILSSENLSDALRPPDYRVDSINSTETIELLELLNPDMIVVNGTRIISSRVLNSIRCPIVNTHAGITPQYRGVHGGYWALAEGRPEKVGTTVHLVDRGIDTGRILARIPFDTSSADSIVTYPYLHLAAGLPLLGQSALAVARGKPLAPIHDDSPPKESRLFSHPTLWGYLRVWATKGVR